MLHCSKRGVRMAITSMRAEVGRQLTFHGAVGTLFGIVLSNWLLTILTLGIYHFWAKVRVRQYVFSNLEFEGDRFDYHGNGWELFLGALKSLLFFIPVAAIAYVLPMGINILFVYLSIAAIVPLAFYGGRRYQMSRLSWRGVRFSFRGRLGECYRIMIVGVLLSPLTFGLYYPHFRAKLTRYWIAHSYFGNTPLHYTGMEKDLFSIYLGYWSRTILYVILAFALMAALVMITGGGIGGLRHLAGGGMAQMSNAAGLSMVIGIQVIMLLMYAGIALNWLWWQAAEHRFHWGHTGFMKANCYSNMSGGAMLVLHIVHGLVYLFTLGLGFAWVKVDLLRFRLSRISVAGFIDFEEVMQELHAAKGSAAADSLADALDIGGIGLEIG